MPKSALEETLVANKARAKRVPAKKAKRSAVGVPKNLYIIDSRGRRRDVSNAVAFVIELGDKEIEVSLRSTVCGVDGQVALISTNGALLTVGPGNGNSLFLRIAQ